MKGSLWDTCRRQAKRVPQLYHAPFFLEKKDVSENRAKNSGEQQWGNYSQEVEPDPRQGTFSSLGEPMEEPLTYSWLEGLSTTDSDVLPLLPLNGGPQLLSSPYLTTVCRVGDGGCGGWITCLFSSHVSGAREFSPKEFHQGPDHMQITRWWTEAINGFKTLGGLRWWKNFTCGSNASNYVQRVDCGTINMTTEFSSLLL